MSPISTSPLDALARRVLALANPGSRIVLGIAGSPGAGKTTLARSLADRVTALTQAAVASTPAAAYLPMDGFHLANSTLDRLGTHDRKGAIDTFDGWGFVALVERVLAERDHTIYAPGFDRTVDEGIAGEIAVMASTEIVIVEGNYLLVDVEPWSRLRALFTETWFCETPDAERVRRLVDRHERHGRSTEAAREWAERVDGANALVIAASAARADLVVSGIDGSILGG